MATFTFDMRQEISNHSQSDWAEENSEEGLFGKTQHTQISRTWWTARSRLWVANYLHPEIAAFHKECDQNYPDWRFSFPHPLLKILNVSLSMLNTAVNENLPCIDRPTSCLYVAFTKHYLHGFSESRTHTGRPHTVCQSVQRHNSDTHTHTHFELGIWLWR